VTIGPDSLSQRAAAKLFQPVLDRVNQANAIINPQQTPGMKLRDLIHEWREQKAVHQRIGSKRAIDSHIGKHIIPRLGDLLLSDINTRTVQRFATDLSVGEQRSEKTLRNILQTLLSAVEWARKLGYATAAFRREDIEVSGREPQEPPSLDAREMGAIIATAKEPYATMFAILAVIGPRAGEMLGLQTTDLDFEERIIHIRHTLDDRTRTLQPTKTKASKNTVPMPPELVIRLQRFLTNGWRGAAFLFTNRNGKPYSQGKVKEYGLWPVQDALGIKRTGFHAFRRGHGSELFYAGAEPAVVQRQLRHKDPRVTLEHYSRVVRDSHRSAVNGLATMIEQKIQSQLESKG
jgi:integrase